MFSSVVTGLETEKTRKNKQTVVARRERHCGNQSRNHPLPFTQREKKRKEKKKKKKEGKGRRRKRKLH